MDDLERLLNAAVTTKWTLSPALVGLLMVGWAGLWNRIKAR